MTRTGLKPYASLSIVRIDGFEPAKDDSGPVDRPGDANWFCGQYGMAPDDSGPADSGILWTDYDYESWRFAILIDTDELDSLKAFAESAGYDIDKVVEVAEPCNFGDGHAGTVEILKHRDGWIVIEA